MNVTPNPAQAQAPKAVSHHGHLPSQQWQDLLRTPYNDAFVSSREEKLALQLYDQLEELKLECKLLALQSSGQTNEPADVSEEQLIAAEREALEARAKYMLRNQITQSALVADPVLKAVHGGANASLAETRLLPLLKERDTLAMIHGHLSGAHVSATSTLSTTQRENMVVTAANKELASELLARAKEVRTQKADDIQDPKLRQQTLAAQAETREARKRWRTLKSVVAGIIVGSGVDWASDEDLQQLILDDEDEIE